MILDNELLMKSIRNEKSIDQLFNSSISGFLDNVVVDDYVSSDKIPDFKFDNRTIKEPASYFFKKYRYITSFNVEDILSILPPEFNSDYKKHKRFPFSHTLHFFDTFIVSEIMPFSSETEFLILTPVTEDTGGADFLNGIMSGSTITALFSAISSDPSAQLALYLKVDQLLEYIRSGLGKKKFFGLF